MAGNISAKKKMPSLYHQGNKPKNGHTKLRRVQSARFERKTIEKRSKEGNFEPGRSEDFRQNAVGASRVNGRKLRSVSAENKENIYILRSHRKKKNMEGQGIVMSPFCIENLGPNYSLQDGAQYAILSQDAAVYNIHHANPYGNAYASNYWNQGSDLYCNPNFAGYCNGGSDSYAQDPSELEVTEKELYTRLDEFTPLPDQLVEHGYPHFDDKYEVHILKPSFRKPSPLFTQSNTGYGEDMLEPGFGIPGCIQRTCVRCDKPFLTTDREYVTKDSCSFHWGKLIHNRYTCCQRYPGSSGCSFGRYHVWSGTVTGVNGPLKGFAQTRPSTNGKKEKVFAMDCEMCYTVKGLELCKITVLAFDGSVVYDHFVKPENEVVDYNTRFSGVTGRDVNSPMAKTFSEVQWDILNLVDRDTILVGHGLENDLRVLKLLHFKVADTAIIFPHERGTPFRKSLKQLVLTTLNKEIQTADSGHSSHEDALSCLELLLFKIYEST